MRAPDDGWERPWQELRCPADTRVSAETSEGRPPPGQPLFHTVTGAGLSTDSTARLLPTRPGGPELLRDPPAPTPHLRTPSSPPSLSHPLGQLTGCSQQPAARPRGSRQGFHAPGTKAEVAWRACEPKRRSYSATRFQRDLPRFFAPGGAHVTHAEPIGVFCRGFAIRTQRLQLRPPGFTSRGHVEPGAVDSCAFRYRPEA